jgi:general secretion pathway protein H
MNRRGSEGFTLLELILVVLVIALAVGVSYPSFTRGTAAVQLRTSARDVMNTMRYARERAITEQQTFLVSANPETGTLVMTDEIGDGARSYTLPREVRIDRLVLDGEPLREGPFIVRFLPNGSAAAAEIQLRSATGSAVRIVTDPITGGARVLAGAAEEGR